MLATPRHPGACACARQGNAADGKRGRLSDGSGATNKEMCKVGTQCDPRLRWQPFFLACPFIGGQQTHRLFYGFFYRLLAVGRVKRQAGYARAFVSDLRCLEV